MAARSDAVVVGAGIVGAAIAWYLARAGIRVTVVEAAAPGGVATRNSLAWINAGWGNPEPYFRLRQRAMAEWRSLQRAVPGLAVAWTGGLCWDLEQDRLEGFAARHASWGYGIRCVDRAAIARIEPGLAAPPEMAVHVAEEGAAEPLDATRALLAAARAQGAAILANQPVEAITLQGGRIRGVVTASAEIVADTVVVAAGAATPALTAGLGLRLPVAAPPALILHTDPQPPLLNGLVMAPEVHLRQTADGRIAASASMSSETPDSATAAAALLGVVGRLLRPGAALTVASHAAGHRPVPADGMPIVGPAAGIPGLYVAVMHSGITLAPAVGLLVSQEVTRGLRSPLLAAYGPDRFAATAA